jgi:hypothetical protein
MALSVRPFPLSPGLLLASLSIPSLHFLIHVCSRSLDPNPLLVLLRRVASSSRLVRPSPSWMLAGDQALVRVRPPRACAREDLPTLGPAAQLQRPCLCRLGAFCGPRLQVRPSPMRRVWCRQRPSTSTVHGGPAALLPLAFGSVCSGGCRPSKRTASYLQFEVRLPGKILALVRIRVDHGGAHRCRSSLLGAWSWR